MHFINSSEVSIFHKYFFAMIRDSRYYNISGKKALNSSFILIGLNCALLQNTAAASQCQSRQSKLE